MNYVKLVCGFPSKQMMVLAETDPAKVNDILLEELFKDPESEYLKSIIEAHNKTPLIVIPPTEKAIPFDENIFGKPFFEK